MLLAASGLLAGGTVLAGAAVAARPGRAARASALLERYSGNPPGPAAASLRQLLATGTSRLLQAARRERGIAARLDAAGIGSQPGEWVLAWSAAGLAAGLLAALAAGPAAGIIAGILTGLTGSRLSVAVRTGRRRSQFSDQLPELLQLTAGSLRAGMSLPQALERVAADAPQPGGAELGRALAETRIGAGIEAALGSLADRMDSRDLRWTVMAIGIHRQSGGNLAEILDITAATMRERAAMRRHVRALSAEGRLSGRILVGLPVMIGGWLFLTDRAYMRPLFTTKAGLAMTCAAVVLILVGATWMRAVSKAAA